MLVYVRHHRNCSISLRPESLSINSIRITTRWVMCQIDRSFANISFAKRCQPNYGLSQKTYICSIELRGGAGYECELRNIFIGVTATFISNGNVHSTRKGLILTPTTPLLTIFILLGGRASFFISPPPPRPPLLFSLVKELSHWLKVSPLVSWGKIFKRLSDFSGCAGMGCCLEGQTGLVQWSIRRQICRPE